MATISTLVGGLLVGHALLGSVVSAGSCLINGDSGKPNATLTTDARSKARELASAQFDFLKAIAANDERLWMQPCTFGEYNCQLDAWEDEQHWARSFEVRPYARAVAFARRMLEGGGLISCQLRAKAQDLPRDVPLLIVGIRNYDANAHLGHDKVMIEVLGWVPLDVSKSPAEEQWQQTTWLPFTREAFDIVQSNR